MAAAIGSSILSALPVFLVATLATQIRESLHFGVVALGTLFSVYYLSAALGSIPLSRLVEAISATRAMRWGCAATGALLLLLAALASNIYELAVIMVATGLSSAMLQPATNLFLIRRIPTARRGMAFGLKQAAVPSSVVIAGLAVPVVALTIGWRWAFAIVALFALLMSFFMPRAHSSLAAYRARPPAPPLSSREVAYLTILTIGFSLGVAAANALSAFIVTALVAGGQSQATAGLLASMGGLVAATTRITMGFQADRRLRSHLTVIAIMLGIGAVAYVILAGAAAGPSLLLLPGMVLAFSAGWGWNGLFSLSIAAQFAAQAARASGIVSVGGRIGGVIGPFVFGVVATHASYSWAWLLAAASAASGAAIIFFGQRMAMDRSGSAPEQA